VVCLSKLTVLLATSVMVFSAILVIFAASLQNTGSPSPKNDSNFNLLFRYGVGAKNELNTFEDTYTKDMVLDPPITIKLTLSDAELEQIHQKMVQIGFFNYPENFPLRTDFEVTPRTDYYIKVENGSSVKEVSWNSNSMLENNIQNNLSQLVDLIRSVVEQKPEYKALPPARGGYL
jgi:hypothetical protein